MRLLKTSNGRIVTGGKVEQFVMDVDLESMRDEYAMGTGEFIPREVWESCFEEAVISDLVGIKDDQINGKELWELLKGVKNG